MALKTNSKDKLAKLPKHQKEVLLRWLVDENLGYQEVKKRLHEDFNVSVGLGTLSKFYRKHCFFLRSSEARDIADLVEQRLESQGNFDKATIALIKQRVGVLTGFAVRCSLVNDINNSVTTVRLTLLDGLTGPDAGIAGATPDNDLAAARGDLVLIIATPVASGGSELNDGVASASGAFKREFCFINTRVAVSGATFDYTVIRGQQGVAARAWTAAGTPQCWIVRATDLAAWNDPSLAGLVSGGGFGYVKLQSFSAFAVADPSTLPLLQFKMKP